MTPWTVQSLWWQYLYTEDVESLRRVCPILRSAARFLVACVKMEEDGKYHIVPTVSCGNWGFTVDYRLNKDCILDLAPRARRSNARRPSSACPARGKRPGV